MDWDITGSTAGIFKVWDRNHVKARRSLAVTFIGLSLALFLFSGCDTESLFGGERSNTNTALQVLGASNTVMAHLDMKSGFDTLEDMLPEDESLSEQMEGALEKVNAYLGLNPREDIHDVYFAMSRESAVPKAGIMAFVSFDQDVLSSRLDTISVLTKLPSEGSTLRYQSNTPNLIHFALINGTMILVSNSADHLNEMVSQAENTDEASGMEDALYALVDDYESWVVVRGVNAMLPEMGDIGGQNGLSNVKPIMKSAENMAMGMSTKGDDLRGAFFIEPSANVEAKDIESLLNGLRAGARLEWESESEVMQELEKLNITTKKGVVRVSTEMDKEDLSNRLKDLGERVMETAEKQLASMRAEK